ncbi:MAG TPA: hypothetical protein VIN71_10185 [Pseudomonadales bacterium]
MQKILFFLRNKPGQSPAQLSAALASCLQDLCSRCYALRYAIADADVAPAAALRINNTAHPKDALVSLWCDHGLALDDVQQQLAALSDGLQRYDVFESQPLKVAEKPGRVEGMCQVALMNRQPALSRKEWLDIWLGSHTEVAIATQSTFSYRQNITVLAESAGPWPCYEAVVEENFPAAAMTDREVFFAAEGNLSLYREHEKRMLESCMRFIDFAAFDCIPMSEYILKPL